MGNRGQASKRGRTKGKKARWSKEQRKAREQLVQQGKRRDDGRA